MAATLVAVLGCVSCRLVNEDELAYRQFSVTLERTDAGSATEFFQPVCLTAPLLLGSVVEEDREGGGPLSMHISVTPEAIRINFSGTAPAASQTREIDISRGVPATEFQVTSRSGAVFSVKVESPCQ